MEWCVTVASVYLPILFVMAKLTVLEEKMNITVVRTTIPQTADLTCPIAISILLLLPVSSTLL